MKTVQHISKGIRWILTILILLFALATFMGKNYGQTACLVLIALLLVYWPGYFSQRFGKAASTLLRILSIAVLIILMQLVFNSAPKTSIYKSEEDKQALMTIYEDCLRDWPENTESHYLSTQYGKVHFLECGRKDKPPLVMFHAASMGAHSWAENLEPLVDHYHIFSFDNPGEGNRSELDDALAFPSTPEEIADLYKTVLDELQIDSAIVFGASNGGFIAQNLAFYHPEKVRKMALFGPMGLTQLTRGSIAMMGISTMYPFQFLRNSVAKWALGSSPACHRKYGDWFNAIMKGTIPSIAQPVPMTTEQKRRMKLPVLLFLGSKDKIVGDAEKARSVAEDYPNIQIEILESGHLIAVEHAEKVNKVLSVFVEVSEF
jgi:pimeloyl-ACP methyl ester carboxylesterase